MGIRIVFLIGLISSCYSINSHAQLSEEEVKQRYASYKTVWPRNKVHLVLNQDKFVPGDTILIKAYLLQENLVRVPGQQIINVTLVGENGQSLMDVKFHATDGVGQNQLIVPMDANSGIYYLTGHTNWMRNFDPGLIFKRKVSIIRNNQVEEVKVPFLHVGIEGGSLISGMPNKICLYTNRVGKPVQITDNSGHEVTRTIIDDAGTAALVFTPEENNQYYVRIVDDTLINKLPVSKKDGMTLHVTPSNNESIQIEVTSSSSMQKEGLLVITSKGAVQHAEKLNLNETNALEIILSAIPYGLFQISLLDGTGSLIAYRNYFNLRKTEVIVDVEPNQDIYKTGDKIKLDITLMDVGGKPLTGEFSIRALNDILFDSEFQYRLQEELELSELGIPIAFNRDKVDWPASLDNFLVATSKGINWHTILSKPLARPSYPITSVIEKTGRVYYADRDTPLPDFSQISFYMQHNKRYVQTFTTDKGRVGFTLPSFYGQDEFFYMAQVLKQDEVTPVSVVWEEDEFLLPKSPRVKQLEINDRYAEFILRKRTIDQSYKVHSIQNDSVYHTDKENDDPWEADITTKVGDFIFFPTLPKFIEEVVPDMYYRKTKRGEIVRVHLVESPLATTADPLFIIDGIATRNTNLFLSLTPSDIKTIKIINTREKIAKAGLLGKYGIVIVDTHKGNIREPLDSESKLIKGLEMSVRREMYNKPAASKLIPDFRSTVYWNPSVKTDANGKATVEFYSSDDIGKVKIRLDGFATGGKPFSSSTDINVIIDPLRN